MPSDAVTSIATSIAALTATSAVTSAVTFTVTSTVPSTLPLHQVEAAPRAAARDISAAERELAQLQDLHEALEEEAADLREKVLVLNRQLDDRAAPTASTKRSSKVPLHAYRCTLAVTHTTLHVLPLHAYRHTR